MRTHNEADLAPHPGVSLVLQGGDAEKFLQALGFESLYPFLFVFVLFCKVSKQGPCFTVIEEDGSDKRRVQLEVCFRS